MPGGYRGIFVQGVLTAFENRGIKADAYSACSSSVLIAAFAATGKIKQLDLSLWTTGYRLSREDNGDQSRAMLHSIEMLAPELEKTLWHSESSRFLIAASRVKTAEAAELTQSDKARRLGRELLLEAIRHNPQWKNTHLELRLFDTAAVGNHMAEPILPHPAPPSGIPPFLLPLTRQNFREAAYASTRMLQAWNVPALIEGAPYVDGSYTTFCPVEHLAGLGYQKILCICTESGPIPPDLFTPGELPTQINGTEIRFIKPEKNLKEMGVDYLSMQENGPQEVFYHGYTLGMNFLHTPLK